MKSYRKRDQKCVEPGLEVAGTHNGENDVDDCTEQHEKHTLLCETCSKGVNELKA